MKVLFIHTLVLISSIQFGLLHAAEPDSVQIPKRSFASVVSDSTIRLDSNLTQDSVVTQGSIAIKDTSEGLDSSPVESAAALESRVKKHRVTLPSKASLDSMLMNALKIDSTLIQRLSIHDVLMLVIKNNPTVIKTKYAWQARQKETWAAWGTFEPSFSGSYSDNFTERERTRKFERIQRYNMGVGGKAFTGADYNLGFNMTDYRNALYTVDEPNAFSGLTVTQPLLKGAWFNAPVAPIRTARVNQKLAYQEYRSQLMQIITQIEHNYWNLYFNEIQYQYSLESVKIAYQLLLDSYQRLKMGKGSPLEFTEAQAALAYRLSNQNEAAQKYMEASNQVKLLIADSVYHSNTWMSASEPLSVAELPKIVTHFQDSAFQAFVDKQPLYQLKKLEVHKSNITVGYQKDQALPELNWKGMFGYSGIGRDKENALGKLKEMKYETWSTEVQVKVPILLGVENRNLLAAEKIKNRMAQRDLSSTKYEIESTVKLIIERIKSLKHTIDNSSQILQFRKDLLDVELARYKAGKGNYQQIFEAEEKLAEAKQFELENQVNYQVSLTQLLEISGQLLLERKLEALVDNEPELIKELTE